MEIEVYIDSLTNCLVCQENGKECDTEYRLVTRTITKEDALELKQAGWKFDWSVPHQNGNEGYVQFTAKTDLVEHYRKTLEAHNIDWHTMYIDSYGAIRLIHKYFKEGD